MKSGKQHIKLPSQEKKQNAWRKGNLQILGNIGRWYHQTSGDKRMLKSSISGELEIYSRQNYRAGAISKGYIPGLFSTKDIQNYYWSRPENKKTNDHAWGLASHWWRWQIICVMKRGRNRTCQHLRQRCCIEITRRLHKKAGRNTNYSHQKQYSQQDTSIPEITWKRKWKEK